MHTLSASVVKTVLRERYPACVARLLRDRYIFFGEEPGVGRQCRDYRVESVVMNLGCSQQRLRVSSQERVEHRGMIGMKDGSVDSGYVHHRLDRFGDVPCGFEHVQQSVHFGRSCQCEVEVSAFTVVGV